MEVPAIELIEELAQITDSNLAAVQRFNRLSEEELNWKQDEKSWSILECIEHLNLYGDFYIPEIEKRIEKAKKAKPGATFKSGLLGNYFANAMRPKAKLNKMKTFKDKNPIGSKLDKGVLQKFAQQQGALIDLLNRATTVDLTKTKTSISISKILKLRLGDTFRVVVYHNQRHIIQANKVIAVKQNLIPGS